MASGSYDNGVQPMSNNNLERLLMDLKESLEREKESLEREIREGFAQINVRFDTQAALEAKNREIAELRERVDKLERRPEGAQ